MLDILIMSWWDTCIRNDCQYTKQKAWNQYNIVWTIRSFIIISTVFPSVYRSIFCVHYLPVISSAAIPLFINKSPTCDFYLINYLCLHCSICSINVYHSVISDLCALQDPLPSRLRVWADQASTYIWIKKPALSVTFSTTCSFAFFCLITWPIASSPIGRLSILTQCIYFILNSD